MIDLDALRALSRAFSDHVYALAWVQIQAVRCPRCGRDHKTGHSVFHELERRPYGWIVIMNWAEVCEGQICLICTRRLDSPCSI